MPHVHSGNLSYTLVVPMFPRRFTAELIPVYQSVVETGPANMNSRLDWNAKLSGRGRGHFSARQDLFSCTPRSETRRMGNNKKQTDRPSVADDVVDTTGCQRTQSACLARRIRKKSGTAPQSQEVFIAKLRTKYDRLFLAINTYTMCVKNSMSEQMEIQEF